MERSMLGSRHGHKSQIPVHVVMSVILLLSGVSSVINRGAFVGAMNGIVSSFYCDIVAMVILIPAAYFIDRGNRIKLSYDVVVRLVLLGMTGVFGRIYLPFIGVALTSEDFAATLQPTIPTFTALIALVFGYEVLHWYRRDGRAKLLGITLCCAGAAVMTFYEGPMMLPWTRGRNSIPWTPISASHLHVVSADIMFKRNELNISHWQLGAFCLISNSLFLALYINLLGPLLQQFPAPTSITAYAYGSGTILMGITAAFSVKDPSAWAIEWDANLAIIIYNGVICSALNFTLFAWCLTRVGPLFVACYIPFQPAITAILAFIFLETSIYLGSIIGTIMIILGLALVSWAYEDTIRLGFLSSQMGPEPLFYRSDTDSFREPFLQVDR